MREEDCYGGNLTVTWGPLTQVAIRPRVGEG